MNLPITVSQAAADPLCARISVGGGESVGHHYCVYRGNLDECIAALDAALNALRTVKYTGKAPPIDPAFKAMPYPHN